MGGNLLSYLPPILTFIQYVCQGDIYETYIEALQDRLASLLKKLKNLEISDFELIEIRDRYQHTQPSECESRLRTFIEKLRSTIFDAESHAIAESNHYLDVNDLKSRRKDYETQINRLKESTLEERLSRTRVIGMTLDRFIRGFQTPLPKLDHIFLDEAGYTSLIKALPLFIHASPITMLGDHEQLPPVVEETNRDRPDCLALWKASAIYGETAFETNSTPLEWLRALNNPPKWTVCNCTTLKTSRRFGENICSVLDRLIYRFGFQSANIENLEVLLLDAPFASAISTEKRRQAPEEVDAIARFLRKNDQRGVAILTPYKNQLHLLSNRFKSLDRDERILSIHRSQGREWDTVILSIVDGQRTGNSPFFTNTQRARGRKVLNTAVSRARKRLILVGDAKYWKSKRDASEQLLSILIDQARPVN